MSDKKISELDAITGANTATDDFFIVVDTSGSATKKISRAELTNSLEVEFNQLNSNLNLNGNNITGTGNINVTGTVTADGNFILETSGGGVNYKGLSRAFFGSLHSSNFAVLGSAAKADETANAQMIATETSTGNGLPSAIQLGAGNIDFHTIANSTANTAFDNKRMRIDKNGDISFYADNGTTQSLFFDASTQRLGLGTTSPATQFHSLGASGTVQTRTSVTGSTASDVAEVAVSTGSRTYLMQSKGSSGDFVIRDSTGAADRITLDSSGNVGIGGLPTYKFQVAAGTDSLVTYSASALDSNIFFDTQNTSTGASAAVVQRLITSDVAGTGTISADFQKTKAGALNINNNETNSAAYTGFGVGGSERMRIDSSGNLLVGTTDTTPWNNSANTTADNGFVVSSNGTTGITRHQAEALNLNRTGNNGSVLIFQRSGTNVGSVSVTTTGTTYNDTSDYRLKENVTDITDATTRLKQLNPVRFNFIADADTTVDGFLAHEVQNVVPEAITGTKDAVDSEGNPVYQGIDQSKLVPLLVKTIQELEARIATLENAQ
jgi:hypothetical protein